MGSHVLFVMIVEVVLLHVMCLGLALSSCPHCRVLCPFVSLPCANVLVVFSQWGFFEHVLCVIFVWHVDNSDVTD